MQKKRNDVKARTNLLLAFPDEHQLRFNKYKTAQELWAAILKTFGGNEATKKSKKNLLKLQYGNFKAEGLKTLEQNFNRLQVIVSQLEFMDIEIEQDDLNQKFLTSLAPEWLMHIIMWRNISDLDTISLDDLYNHLKVYEPEVQKKSESNSQNMAFISSAKNSSRNGEVKTASILTASTQVSLAGPNVATASISLDTACAYIASQSNGSRIKYEDINQNDEDDIDEIDTKTDVAGFDKSKVECFNCHKMGHFASECWAPRSQERGRRENYRQEDNHALVADKEATTEFALMAKSSSDNEVFDNSLCSKACLSQVEARLVEFKSQEIKFCEKIRGLELDHSNKNFKIELLTNELEQAKKEKGDLDSKLTGFQSASKDLDNLLGSQRNDKNKEGLGYSVVPPPPAQGNSQINIDDKDYEPFDGGYVSFGQGGCKITSKGTIKTSKLKFENVYFVKDLKRLGHLNSKTMNRLVRHNLVRGLPSKCFDNDHTCAASLKGKQHKASCKTKFVNSVTKPLHTLHMDLFGPTSVSSLNHKWYCLVATDDFSRCDNRGEFRNKEMNDFRSRKGIKREFSNARTPQQNRVAKRRNRTLIEASKTMVLVNKSQNKTPYELFNGRTPVIGFLKPFGCHVMILNTLDHLGKFKAKGNEGYFIGYFMSSKAFRVFNMRTKRVEENLHVDFLENKPIEKGDGPNWLFNINSLTNSMNYVPVVVTGTSSTNFSGTKEAAHQDVKKDVSSLRYIALPNWFHEEHLKSSTSNAQDACNADAPESSGNSNPTATSTNPPADHMETLAMETLIPTVSSPVLTACLNDSSEPSSDTRLISKRVTSQDDTPSLDNILTLTNRFEDILGVTTNTDDSNGLEADFGNMEYDISASPTPTLRIHKDHLKSQIIGPVDTPVQTRNKSKEMEEQSFIATIHQKTNLTLLQFCLFSCFLSQEEPKKISDALQDPS
uniref:CCHC-type domain-containing protein n=1 Tax=Tanacetum cinerariifolium TaxID=118510 RepID=A0A6L2JSS4_TANCI|nr:hypothetical protein [Tanacetum cinerariifolium]